MPISARMIELQTAMNCYGDGTIRHMRILHAFGNALIENLTSYLGDGAKVIGVPPKGDFRTDVGDFRDAKFSTYHTPKLSLKPIMMGLSVGIPHSNDSGVYWPRVVLEMEMEHDSISLRIGDDSLPKRGISLQPEESELTEVSARLFDYMIAILENPVKIMSAQGSGKFGFATE